MLWRFNSVSQMSARGLYSLGRQGGLGGESPVSHVEGLWGCLLVTLIASNPLLNIVKDQCPRDGRPWNVLGAVPSTPGKWVQRGGKPVTESSL